MSNTARNSLKLSVMTMISRVLGLFRDHYQAVFFGTGAIATAWEIAFMFPNMLRNLLAEGVLAQSFLPIYSDALRISDREARRVAGVILSFLFFFLLIFVAVVIMLFPKILPYYTGKEAGEIGLLIELSQVMFVFILTASLTAIFAGMANAHLFFTLPALSPILLNILFISGFLLLDGRGYPPQTNARYLAGVVVLGGIVQLAFQALYVRHLGLWPILTLRFRDPALRKIFSLMAPAVLGAGLFQLNQLLDIAIASYWIPEEQGAVPGLRFAHRLIQLPTGIIGTALSTAILPALAAHIRSNEGESNATELNSALSFAFFLTVPAGIGLYLLGPSIIDLLFYGGAWNEHSTAATWLALQFYTLGVPLYSGNKILTSTYYAYQDTRSPVKVMLVVIVINLILNLILVRFMYQGGLALSTALCSFLTGSVLFLGLKKKMPDLRIGNLIGALGRQVPLWMLLAAYLLALESLGGRWMAAGGNRFAEILGSPEIPRYIGLVHILIGIGGALPLYFVAARLLGLKELRVFRRMRE